MTLLYILLLSLEQTVFLSVTTSVTEVETGHAVLPETQEQITHSVVVILRYRKQIQDKQKEENK